MLRSLTIENYGLIAQARIEFSSGATMFTGETGSGKTMVLGAIGFAFGERASPEALRRGAARCVVALEFDPGATLRERFARDGYELDPDEYGTIVREMTDGGKSTIRVNGRPSTAGYVREVAAQLADFIGQHDAQRLLVPSYHVEVVDRFAGEPARDARERTQAAHQRLTAAATALEAFDADERRASERLAFARFALEEIEGAAPQPGEDEQLSDRRRYLENVERIASALRSAHEALAGDEGAAADALGTAAASLEGLASIAPVLAELAQSAAALQSENLELATRIARELDATEFDSQELEHIGARLDTLEGLKRKYGGTLRAVLEQARGFRETVSLYAERGERRAACVAEVAAARDELAAAASALSAVRRGAALRLCERARAELAELALPAARFEPQFEPLPQIGPAGAERVEFVFAADPGEPLRPLARVASGGELSRVLLALVVTIAGTREPTALIFDEIDAGIGGATAAALGERLGRVAAGAQLICVTHLAQLATWADRHYVLEKRERAGAAAIEVREALTPAQREAELARMLSGEPQAAALQHARALLEQTARRRSA